MAIQKNKVLASGASGNYWVIRGIYISPDTSATRAFADLYVDAATALSDAGNPIHTVDIVLDGINNPFNPVSMAQIVQAKLITLPGDFLSGVEV